VAAGDVAGGGQVIRPHPDTLEEWPNCETPDCEYKQCTWSGTPLCFPCAEREVGHSVMVALYNLTHDITWEEAHRLDSEEGR
jgi:hypothetical protein